MTAAGSHPESGRGGGDWNSGFLPQAPPRLFRSPWCSKHSESSPGEVSDLRPEQHE